ncbi:hypothetical protein N7492_001681 [Penicillium capsulatum]|uniref:RRM domain-containing protein n=1 Tax=Penicillium capsulatum TaxID=69766 RepID=A0A9W9IW18_9EURO|nr:hypothetical protein N7492_001681 [Penicillium capsulatum]
MTQPSAKSTAGVLQIPAAATQKSASSPAKKAHKTPTPRLKLLIRRLPPGLTQLELESALGEEWKAGAGKVDWLQYKPGKVSKDPAKPSRPSRAYLRLTSSDHIAPLSEQVRRSSFQDARNTSYDPILLGPPSLEFAPYAKTPGSRVRKDARQGTIDQDPDFISFLESLTQPLTKAAPVDSAEGEEKKEAVVTTPLVQYIKDKKASKARDNAASKSSKHGREKESKQEKVQAKKLLQRSDKEAASAATSEKKTKGEKGSKESAKSAKQAAASAKAGKANASTTNKDATTTAPERKRERGNVNVASKIVVQRDLGISPAGGRRRGKGSVEAGSSKNESSRESSAPAREGTKKDSAPKAGKNAGGAGPAKAKDGESPSSKASDVTSSPAASTPPTKTPKAAKAKPSASPAPTATQAFLKHANPSQGVTEAILETTFSVFGAVTKVEIDKKKGFGYVDFAEPEGLQKAMSSSPVSVAHSQVVVLERKANPGEKSLANLEAMHSQTPVGKPNRPKVLVLVRVRVLVLVQARQYHREDLAVDEVHGTKARRAELLGETRHQARRVQARRANEGRLVLMARNDTQNMSPQRMKPC